MTPHPVVTPGGGPPVPNNAPLPKASASLLLLGWYIPVSITAAINEHYFYKPTRPIPVST